MTKLLTSKIFRIMITTEKEYQVILDDIMSGNIDESSISTIFSKLNLSMVSGAVLGAATIALLNNYLSKKNIKEEE